MAATLGDSRDLGTLACAAVDELGGHDGDKAVVLGNGAGWIKTESEQHFAYAGKILDRPHLWRATQQAVRVTRGGKACRAERRALYEQLRGCLWRGMASEALTVLVGLRGPEKVEALEAAIRYMRNQQDWIGNYGSGEHRDTQ